VLTIKLFRNEKGNLITMRPINPLLQQMKKIERLHDTPTLGEEGVLIMGPREEDIENMKILLKESDFAFTITMETGGVNNTDYADYTSNNFIRGFRHLMQKPDLSRAQLASMLRAAERRRRQLDNTNDQWADTIATVIASGANNNNANDVVV